MTALSLAHDYLARVRALRGRPVAMTLVSHHDGSCTCVVEDNEPQHFTNSAVPQMAWRDTRGRAA